MAAIAILRPTFAGLTLTTQAAAGGGDTLQNDGQTVLYVKNGGGASINVTITPAATPDGLAFAPRVVAVGAGAERLLGPYPPVFFNDVNGQVAVTYSAVTSVVVAGIGILGV
jgi:hypothetical protein